MRRIVVALLATLTFNRVAAAAPRVTILFLGADIREPVPVAEHPRPELIQRRFRIRVDVRGFIRTRHARLFAALPADVQGRRLRLDGVELSTKPQLITASAVLGEPETHALEIETLAPVSDGIAETIVWTAEVR